MNHARNPVGWFEIHVQDLDRGKSFYEKTFDLELTPLLNYGTEMLAFPGGPDGYGACGALVEGGSRTTGDDGTIIYFSCDDCAATAARAEKNGGKISQGKSAIGSWGFIAQIVDLDGNMIGLHSLK